MEHPVERPVDLDVGGDVVAREVPLRMPLEMDHVRGTARDEVVHPHHLVPGGEQAIAEM
jgi:hypothetical protein